jgi:hypothetical protein
MRRLTACWQILCGPLPDSRQPCQSTGYPLGSELNYFRTPAVPEVGATLGSAVSNEDMRHRARFVILILACTTAEGAMACSNDSRASACSIHPYASMIFLGTVMEVTAEAPNDTGFPIRMFAFVSMRHSRERARRPTNNPSCPRGQLLWRASELHRREPVPAVHTAGRGDAANRGLRSGDPSCRGQRPPHLLAQLAGP